MSEIEKELAVIVMNYLREQGGEVYLNGTRYAYKGGRIEITS